jgi:aminoglycoside 6'-N-acetyltransferase
MQKNDWQEISQFQESSDSPGFLLWQIYLLWKRKIEAALLPHNITHVQFVLLAGLGYLTKKGISASQKDLAKFTSCDINMTSQVLRELEKKQLITRIQKAGDDRTKYPILTDEGLNKLASSIKDVENVDQEFFGILGNKQNDLIAFMQNLLNTPDNSDIKVANQKPLSSSLNFIPLSQSHFYLLYKWINTPHVTSWWGENKLWPISAIEEKYLSYTNNCKEIDGVKKPIYAFIINYQTQHIGYIQYYDAYDFPREQGYVLENLPKNLAAIDIYIGEENYLGKGFGHLALEKFLEQYIWPKYDACFVDVDPQNTQAIFAYKKAGFQIIKTLDDGTIWMLRNKS